MKPFAPFAFTLSLLALCGSALAHPGHTGAHTPGMYSVSWIGTAPKSFAAGTPVSMASIAAPDFWKRAFVSKYRILGPGFSVLP